MTGSAGLSAATAEVSLTKLVKKLAKLEARQSHVAQRLSELALQVEQARAALAAAQALPDETPQQQKAHKKAVKKHGKRLARLLQQQDAVSDKGLAYAMTLATLREEIAALDPDFFPPGTLGPKLTLDKESLSFVVPSGASQSDPELFKVVNTGEGQLSWSAVADAPWLLLSPSSGVLATGSSESVRAGVDASGLSSGSFDAVVTVSSPEALNPPETLAVEVDVGAPEVQSGLLGEYFDDIALTMLADTRIDASIDFTTWGAAPSGTAVLPDGHYSERWTGFVSIVQAGAWTFTTNSNDGVRLWIDGQLLIDHWDTHTATLDSGLRTLDVGWHALRLEHFQSDGSVVIQLSFSGPGQPLGIVPASHLAVATGSNQPPWVEAAPVGPVVLPQSTVALSASAGDADGVIASWAWTQSGGPAVTLGAAGSAQPLVSGIVSPGAYAFDVTVTDDQGGTASDSVGFSVLQGGGTGPLVSGTLLPWHRVSVDFHGPAYDEAGSPNPFLDRRLQVGFTHVESGATYVVPGYFAADGAAAESGATTGSTWRAHLTPPAPGLWTFAASFRAGSGIATSLDPLAGTPADFDGAWGSFVVAPAIGGTTGFRAAGRLVYDGEHFLRHEGSGQPFLKGGADSPENLLAYVGFDQTPEGSHEYLAHVADWAPGDPSWHGGMGKGLVGALNYLAAQGMNSVYFLTFNVGGDGDDVWPWTSKAERLRFDCSKLDQWELVFEHMDDLGLALHVVTQEQENDNGAAGLDGGALGTQRKLYYRELVARFGHHLGVVWNLGEENTNTQAQRQQFYDHIRALDAYDHPIVVHTYPEQQSSLYLPALAVPMLEGPSLQNAAVGLTHAQTLQWRSQSAASGRPWVVTLDEFGPANEGVLPDGVDPAHDAARKEGLWGNLLAGGAGVEWYFGYAYAHSDLSCEDWRSRANMWKQTDIALDFFRQHVPFALMQPEDALVGAGAWCLAQVGEKYLVYLRNGGSTTLDLGGVSGNYRVRWFDPRQGGALQVGSVGGVPAGGVVSLGTAPSAPTQDWAVLVVRL